MSRWRIVLSLVAIGGGMFLELDAGLRFGHSPFIAIEILSGICIGFSGAAFAQEAGLRIAKREETSHRDREERVMTPEDWKKAEEFVRYSAKKMNEREDKPDSEANPKPECDDIFCMCKASKEMTNSKREPMPRAPEEGLCQSCGAQYPTPWFTDNPVWNQANSKGNSYAFLCVNCFIRKAQQVGVQCSGWRLVACDWIPPENCSHERYNIKGECLDCGAVERVQPEPRRNCGKPGCQGGVPSDTWQVGECRCEKWKTMTASEFAKSYDDKFLQRTPDNLKPEAIWFAEAYVQHVKNSVQPEPRVNNSSADVVQSILDCGDLLVGIGILNEYLDAKGLKL